MLHDLHFLIFTCFQKIQSFSLALFSEAISNLWTWFDCTKNFTLIPYSSCFSLLSIRNYKWKLGIVSFFFFFGLV